MYKQDGALCFLHFEVHMNNILLKSTPFENTT